MKDKDDELADFVNNENKSIREFPKKIFSLPFRVIKYLIDFLLNGHSWVLIIAIDLSHTILTAQ